jgi:hypothetical protein
MWDLLNVPFETESSLSLKLVLLVASCWLVWQWFSKKRYNFPPGPRNFPILGCMPLVDHKTPVETFSKWAKKFGRLYYCKIGKDNVIVLNDPVLVRTVFSYDSCNNRPGNPGTQFRKAESGGHCGQFTEAFFLFQWTAIYRLQPHVTSFLSA